MKWNELRYSRLRVFVFYSKIVQKICAEFNPLSQKQAKWGQME